jgi:hypothetical protein
MVAILQLLTHGDAPSKYQETPKEWENKVKQLIDKVYYKEALVGGDVEFSMSDVDAVDMTSFTDDVSDKYYIVYNELIDDSESVTDKDDDDEYETVNEIQPVIEEKVKVFIFTETDEDSEEEYIEENAPAAEPEKWWVKYVVGGYVTLLLGSILGSVMTTVCGPKYQ